MDLLGQRHRRHQRHSSVCADHARAGEEGHVINTSSGNGGIASLPTTPVYASSKAAVTSLTEVLHFQFLMDDAKLHAHVLFPGPHLVNTNILNSDRVRPDAFRIEGQAPGDLRRHEGTRRKRGRGVQAHRAGRGRRHGDRRHSRRPLLDSLEAWKERRALADAHPEHSRAREPRADAVMKALLETQRAAFVAEGFVSAETRLDRLERALCILHDNQTAIADALDQDFGNRSRHQTLMSTSTARWRA